MKIRTATALAFLCVTTIPLYADECKDACQQTYEECKQAHDSPNGEKICGSDYHECERQCAENQ